MRYDVIFMDIDNTLLDFDAATRSSLADLLGRFGLALTAQREQRFHVINNRLWTAYEHGEIPKSAIFARRFAEFLGELGVEADPLEANEWFAQGLRQSAVLMPGCLDLLDALQGRCRLFAVTNGVVTTQLPRLERSGLNGYFEQVFISEAMGCKKPEKAFFDRCFDAIGPVDKSRCLILGDSLTSDMQGGRNAGIATCYFGEKTGDPRCDYVIANLPELLPLLELD